MNKYYFEYLTLDRQRYLNLSQLNIDKSTQKLVKRLELEILCNLYEFDQIEKITKRRIEISIVMIRNKKYFWFQTIGKNISNLHISTNNFKQFVGDLVGLMSMVNLLIGDRKDE